MIQGDVVLDVFRDEHAVLLRHGPEVTGGEHWVGRQFCELLAFDDVAHSAAGDVRLEVGLDGRDGGCLFGFVVGDELGELLFQ